jgi:hypothetical protein
MAVLALAVVAMALSIFAATERRITITRATLTPDGTVYVTYRYPIGGEHQMRATAWSYGEWVAALRSKGWRVTEVWR